jgi:hypothetical protein
MESLNDHSAWMGNVEDAIAMSIRDSGKPLVDLTLDDGEAGPSGAVKDEHADPRGKQNVINEDDYRFFEYYDRSDRRRRH